MNTTKEDLLDDFEDAPEVPKSGLYRQVYTAEYGQFGGKPYGAIVGNFEFGPGPQDVKLLQYLASVAGMSHAPFFAAAGKEFFGISSWEELPNLKDLNSIFESPQYTKWQSFRESEDARNVALTLPRFLLRLPYGQDTLPTKTFNYNEDVTSGSEAFCWGNTAFAFASRLTDSFAKYRWCANIIGPQGGGAVEDLPLYQFEAMPHKFLFFEITGLDTVTNRGKGTRFEIDFQMEKLPESPPEFKTEHLILSATPAVNVFSHGAEPILLDHRRERYRIRPSDMREKTQTVLDLEVRLRERIKGQDPALAAVAKEIRAAQSGIKDPAQPQGVFLLVGPSGVGKTETALALADLLFGGEKNAVTINLSEFQEAHTVSRLIGSPPGYVGYGEGGRLTEAVRQKPYSVVILDEAEKAHINVMTNVLGASIETTGASFGVNIGMKLELFLAHKTEFENLTEAFEGFKQTFNLEKTTFTGNQVQITSTEIKATTETASTALSESKKSLNSFQVAANKAKVAGSQTEVVVKKVRLLQQEEQLSTQKGQAIVQEMNTTANKQRTSANQVHMRHECLRHAITLGKALIVIAGRIDSVEEQIGRAHV